MSIPVSFWTPKADDSGLVEINDDWLIDNGYDEIYNGNGERRFYKGSPGLFYQTYGNGGGPGGWGGYWIQDCNQAVWQVEGEVFTLLEGKSLSLRSVPYFPVSLHWWCKLI
jgi:hypothetical protein